ncbi:hypothetical protein K4F52_004088 [Lecanicillium sp. MT-2017a]|nr:hypothetical protein K4F52_004088 [Lecanicillium sp. MT-2017a]
MAGSDETPEYDPEPFARRKTFYIKAECELAGTSNPLHGKMFVESLVPLMKQQQYPIVLIHGDYHTGQIWLTKPDGKPGWAAAFLHAGYQVYVIDLPPIGRSNIMTDQKFADKREKLNFMPPALAEKQLTAPQKTDVENELENLGWPTAIFHDKWPGTGKRGDTTFENYHMSTSVLSLQKEERQLLAQTALRNLLKESGKAILLGQGSGTTMAWLAADAEPDLVAGVIAVEPAGPPFGLAHTMVDKRRQYTESVKLDLTNRLYGLADIPLTYEPPTRPVKMEDNRLKVVPFDLDLYKEPITGGTCILQRDANKTRETQPLTNLGKSSSPCRPRQLIHLKKMPHVVVTAQAGSHSMFDWATVMFMLQAGLSLEWMRLEQHSIFGNGHLMFLETNSNEIAALLFDWINRAVKECQSPTSTFTLTDEELHFDGSSFQPIDLTVETDPHMTHGGVTGRDFVDIFRTSIVADLQMTKNVPMFSLPRYP